MQRRITITLISLTLLLGFALGSLERGANAKAHASPPKSSFAASAMGCATPSFAAAVNFGVGNAPVSVAAGDFNLDGKLDLAAANGVSDNVSVLLGNGSGGFGAATNFAAGNIPISVVVGDFNLDGKLDLATANASSDNVSVLLGNGSGGFGAATNFAVGNVPISVVVGDFNLDGKPDLAAANTNLTGTVSVLLGDGSGGFGAATNFEAGARSLTVGDFNLDGKPDLAGATGGDVLALLGDGSGGFGAATYFAVADGPTSVVVGDFNLDGKPDLATANLASHNVSVLLGNGSGGFGAAVSFAVGTNPISVAAGDFNGDGKPDLAAANQNSDDVSVLFGDGGGGFGASVNFAVGDEPLSVAVGDFNGDGRPDLTAANNNSNNVSVLLNACTSNTAPIASCRNITVPANAGCTATITAAQVDNGSSDPDAGDSISLALSSTGPFAPGNHLVTLTVTDSHGASSSCTAVVTVADQTAPDTSLTSTPPALSGANVSFGFSGADSCGVSGFECKLDGGAWTACASPQSYTGLANGAHSFQVRAKDAAGNVDATPASYAWQVLANTCGTTVNPATLAQPSIGLPYLQIFSATPAGSYTFSLVAGALPPGVQLVTALGVSSLAGIPTTPGTYNFTIRAKKNNANCEGIRGYTVTIAPTVAPILNCVMRNANGSYTAKFGYDNSTSAAVTIPVGANNYFTPGAQNRGQTTTFQPGVVTNAFSVTFAANGGNLGVWFLKGPDNVLRPVNVLTTSIGCP
jgi:hypothetical protein